MDITWWVIGALVACGVVSFLGYKHDKHQAELDAANPDRRFDNCKALIDETGIVADVQFQSETSTDGNFLAMVSSTNHWMIVKFDDIRVVRVPVGSTVEIAIGKKYRIARYGSPLYETLIRELP